MVKRLRDVADKANLQKRKKNDKFATNKIREFKKEAISVLKRIYQEINQASRQGKSCLRIPAIQVGIHELSEGAFQTILQDLQQKGLKVEVNRDTSCDTLGLETPGAHDIEGYEKYCEELEKRTKRFIQDITIRW